MAKVSLRSVCTSVPATSCRVGGLAILGLSGLLTAGCPQEQPTPTGPKADTKCSKELPAECKVLKDEMEEKKNSVEYHVLLPAKTKHDEAQKHMEALYRHLMT